MYRQSEKQSREKKYRRNYKVRKRGVSCQRRRNNQSTQAASAPFTFIPARTYADGLHFCETDCRRIIVSALR